MKRTNLILSYIIIMCSCLNSFGKDLSELVPSTKDLDPVFISSDPEYYTADNLYDYINGGAPAYIASGFEKVVTFLVMNPDSLEMVVDIYDMADSLNAFGIYSQERSARGKPAAFGSDGMLYGNAIYFWQDRYYVKLIAYETSARANEFLNQMAGILTRKLPKDGSRPVLFSVLPDNNKIQNSEKFIRRDVLGQQYLQNGYSSEYDLDGEKYQIILLSCENSQNAGDKLTQFRLFKKETGAVTEINEQTFSATDSYYGNMYFTQKGEYIIGVLGKIENARCVAILKSILELL